MEEEVAGDVALPGRPVLDAGEEPQAAGVGREQVVGTTHDVRGVGAQTLQEQFHAGPDGAAGRGGRFGRTARGAGGQAAQMLKLGVLQQEGAGEESTTDVLGRVTSACWP